MKLNYLAPIAETVTLTLGTKMICASGENLVTRSYGSNTEAGEDVNGFWN